MRGAADGRDPVEFLIPFTDKLKELALAGEMTAMRELFDRLDGKAAQQIQLQGDADAPFKIVHESK